MYSEFVQGEAVPTEPIVNPPGTLEALHRSLLLFYTGRQRAAEDVLSGQREAIVQGAATRALRQMRDVAYEMRDALGAGDAGAVGDLLDRNWQLKRSLTAGVT